MNSREYVICVSYCAVCMYTRAMSSVGNLYVYKAILWFKRVITGAIHHMIVIACEDEDNSKMQRLNVFCVGSYTPIFIDIRFMKLIYLKNRLRNWNSVGVVFKYFLKVQPSFLFFCPPSAQSCFFRL